eukprot:g6685.t1
MDVDGDGSGNVGGDAAAVAAASEAERFALLKGAVKDSPSDYTAHLSLVQYLRKERPGSLELSKARQGFADKFPLSPELWQEWIDDRRAAGGEDAVADVLVLYGRAFADYQCAKLWPGYLETLEESLDEDDEGGVSTMREAFERALSCVGVHPILGGAVWRALLRFEKEELEDAQETGESDALVSIAQDRVKRVYRRQLSVPLVDNDEILEEAKEVYAGDDDGFKEASHAHTKANKMLAARMEHEQVVMRCQENDPGGPGAANAWEAYAAFEAADGHPSRAALVLERAESEGCCLHERIWVTHSDLLLAQMGAKDQEETLTARAVRNLPWSAELWCRRLRSLERSSEKNSFSTVSSGEVEGKGAASAAAAGMRRVWKEALGSALPSPDEYVKVLLAYCASFRRRLLREVEAAVKGQQSPPEAVIDPTVPGQREARAAGEGGAGGSGARVALALEGVRRAFYEAEAFVDKNYPGWDEGWLTVVLQRIQIEDEVVEDIADLGLDGVVARSEARRQWDRVLRHSGKRLASWTEAVKWERRTTGDLAACRRLYARSMKEVQDFPEAAYTAYLNFEQETGSLQDWDAANKEVFNSRAARGLLSRDLPLVSRAWTGGAAAQPLHQPTQRQQKLKAKKQQQQRQQQQARDRGDRRAAATNKRSAPGPPLAEPGAESEDAQKNGNKRARTTPTNESGSNQPLAVRESPGKKRGRGAKDEEGAGSRGGGVAGLTAFVVNLPFSTTHAGLKDMFAACGEVTGTRVLTNPKGRPKGVGYVTFASEEALVKALALNGTDIDGRAISVERSLPRGARPAKGAAHKAAAEPADSTPTAAATTPGRGGEGRGGVGDGNVGGGEQGDAGEANSIKSKKKRKAEGEVVVFGAGTGARAGGGGGGGGIKWPAHPTTVFVRGLGMSATSSDLREAFVGAGAVVEARVVEDKKTRETKGYGLVQFEEAEAVEKALAMDGTSMCGGTAKVTRSRHPAVVVAPAPAPAPAASTETSNGSAGAAAGAAVAGGTDGSSNRRADDWDCPNADCDNVCFSFRTMCNRCGTGKDGTPPPENFRQGGGGVKGGGSAGEPVVATLQRPRLQLGSGIKPRALRNPRSTNGAERRPVVLKKTAVAAGAAADAAAPAGGAGRSPTSAASSDKTNDDFRAMLTRK